MKKKIVISTREELDNLLRKQGTLGCFVSLNFGLRSSKEISFTQQGDYLIFNDIDGTEEIISHDKLRDSFIGKAMRFKALIAE